MIKVSIRLTVILIGFSLVSCLVNKNNEKFVGESLLNDCQIEIPLYYGTKHQKTLAAAVKKYKDVEIVLVTKQNKEQASYSFYYLVGYEGSYGPSAYLVESKDTKSKSKIFLGYKPKKHTFYNADCFRKKLEEDKSLNENLEELK